MLKIIREKFAPIIARCEIWIPVYFPTPQENFVEKWKYFLIRFESSMNKKNNRSLTFFSHHNKHHPGFEIFSYLHLFAMNTTAPLGWKCSVSKNKHNKKENI